MDNYKHTLALDLDLTNISPSDTISQSMYLSQTIDFADTEIGSIFDTIQSQNGDDSTIEVELSPCYGTTTVESDDILGQGGMGIVKLGQQCTPDREVAIKSIKSDSAMHERMLLQEALYMGQLEHPNIPPIHEIHQNSHQRIQVVMKRIKGETLTEIIQRRPENPNGFARYVRQGIHILTQVCHALEFAHSHNIVHRDIKSDNIMVGEFNQVFLMDWGLAMNIVTKTGFQKGLVGTPSYLAPEMLSGDPRHVGAFTDIYLLGATLHHILIGSPRHNTNKVAEALDMAEQSVPYAYPTEIPTPIGEVVNKACHIDPSQRFENVLQFRVALQNSLEQWKVIELCEKGASQCLELQNHTAKASISIADEQTIQRLFLKTRSLYETALELAPTSRIAKEGHDHTLLLMIDHYLETQNSKLALSLYLDLLQSNTDLEREIKEAVSEMERLEKSKHLAEQYDPVKSHQGRKFLMVSLAASAVALVAFAITYQYMFHKSVSTTRLLGTSSVVFFATIIGSFMGRNTLLSNQLGRQMSKGLILGSFLAFINTFVGHVHNVPVEAIMTLDQYILAVVFSSLTGVVVSANGIVIFCMLTGSISLIWPFLSHAMLLISILCSTLWSLADWYKEADNLNADQSNGPKQD